MYCLTMLFTLNLRRSTSTSIGHLDTDSDSYHGRRSRLNRTLRGDGTASHVGGSLGIDEISERVEDEERGMKVSAWNAGLNSREC